VLAAELCGLKWGDVDLDNGEIFIARGVVRVAGRPLIDKDTKTHAKRRVAIGADTAELLKSYRIRQARPRWRSAQVCPLTPMCSPSGWTAPSQPAPTVSPIASSNSLPKLGVRARLHDLRHFMVTQLVVGGVDWRTVSGRAGHADGHMTLGTYAHFRQAQDRQAAEFMDRLLGAAATDPR
jgi:integrase